MKTTMFVAALAAMILGQASVSAADSTPAILKSVKARKSLNAGQMKKVKGEYWNGSYAYLYTGGYSNAYLYGKYNVNYSAKYNVNYSSNYNLNYSANVSATYLYKNYYGHYDAALYSLYGYGW